MISWLPRTVLHSWQAVDILRLDNQTANVSSCLSLLSTDTCSLVLPWVACSPTCCLLTVLPCLTATETVELFKKQLPTHYFSSFVSNLLEFLLPVPFLLKVVVVHELLLFAMHLYNDMKAVNYKQVLIITYTDNYGSALSSQEQN